MPKTRCFAGCVEVRAEDLDALDLAIDQAVDGGESRLWRLVHAALTDAPVVLVLTPEALADPLIAGFVWAWSKQGRAAVGRVEGAAFDVVVSVDLFSALMVRRELGAERTYITVEPYRLASVLTMVCELTGRER